MVGGSAVRRERAPAMKSGLRSMAVMETWRDDVMVGSERSWVVRIRGPQALSRMRRVGVVVGEGREEVVRAMRCLARVMLQPPVRSL